MQFNKKSRYARCIGERDTRYASQGGNQGKPAEHPEKAEDTAQAAYQQELTTGLFVIDYIEKQFGYVLKEDIIAKNKRMG